MTLVQLKYAVAVADKGSINEAAKILFISQPSLSNSIKELENELDFSIFVRTNRGITPTIEGNEFLGYARQVLQQAELLEQKYLKTTSSRQRFSVSTHHYLFAANAFVELIKEFGGDEYEFIYRETKTYEVIDDVRNLRSELGLIYLSRFNSPVIEKLLKESNLVFSKLFTAQPHVFISKFHPLALSDCKRISLSELDEYPCLTFEQGEQNSFYFSEEILSTRTVKKHIKVSDRAAVVNMMIGLNGYTISTGIFPEYLHGEDIISVPLDADELINVGIITHRDFIPTKLGEIYISQLRNITENLINQNLVTI